MADVYISGLGHPAGLRQNRSVLLGRRALLDWRACAATYTSQRPAFCLLGAMVLVHSTSYGSGLPQLRAPRSDRPDKLRHA